MPVEILVGAAVGAAVTSTSVRKVVRRGVVYGLAGGLIAYDKVAALASGVVHGAREGMAKAAGRTSSAEPTAPPSEQQTKDPQPPQPLADPSS